MNREEAINVIKGARKYLTVGNPIWNVKKVDEAMNMAIEALSIDAVQGEWQKVEEQPYFRKHYDTVCCSVCRKKGNRKWNFCPSCGARMTPCKGGEDE